MVIKQFSLIVLYFILFIFLLWAITCFWGIDKVDNVDGSARFAAIIAIFVFGFGLFIKTIEDKIKQIKKDKQLKRVIIHNLQSIANGLKLQIDNFQTVIKTLKSAQPNNALIYSFAELDYFEINNFDSEDLYRIFIDNFKGEENEKIDKTFCKIRDI